jgi:hypothetical protein
MFLKKLKTVEFRTKSKETAVGPLKHRSSESTAINDAESVMPYASDAMKFRV